MDGIDADELKDAYKGVQQDVTVWCPSRLL